MAMKRTTAYKLFVCLTAAVFWSSCFATETEKVSPRASITVSLNEQGRVIPPSIFGSNLQWEWNGDRILVENNNEFALHPGIVEAISGTGVRVLRFPGGTLSNTYQWKSGIGSRRNRPSGLSYGKEIIPSNFGSDEFIKLCHDLGLNALITVNFNSTPEEAAEWVEYLNGGSDTAWGKKRIANGNARPLNATYWEIGNEIYSPLEAGYTTAAAYAKKLVAFSRHMKSRHPSIKIGAGLEVSFLQAAWMDKIYPHMTTWNEEVLKIAGQDIDFVSLHYYTPFDKTFDKNVLKKLIWAGPLVFEQNTKRIKSLLRKYSRPGVEVVVSEYNIYFGEKKKLGSRIASTDASLYMAMMMFGFIRDEQITMANHWSLLNNDVFGMLKTERGKIEITRRPTYEVFRDLAKFAGYRVLKSSITANGYSVDAKGNIPHLEEVPYVDFIAAGNSSGEFMIAAVNRSPLEQVKASISFSGTGTAEIKSFESVYPESKGESGKWLQAADIKLHKIRNNMYGCTLPAESFTVFKGSQAPDRNGNR